MTSRRQIANRKSRIRTAALQYAIGEAISKVQDVTHSEIIFVLAHTMRVYSGWRLDTEIDEKARAKNDDTN